MDLLKEIKEQISSIKKYDASIYIESIYVHIYRAEYYYEQGKSDNNFFNDVIYRSNQAFEGALREAYKILAEKNDTELSKTNTYNIEKYFEDNGVFRERVLQLFTNYRKEWRNKSAHDFKLFFDESEAFIALMNVSSFVHLLLNQIQEKVAAKMTEKLLEEDISRNTKFKFFTLTATPTEIILNIISEFINQYKNQIQNDASEYEIIGYLYAYLEFDENNINVDREPKIISNKGTIRPDFIISINDKKVILELKQIKRLRKDDTENGINQLLQYMEIAQISDGILFNIDFSKKKIEMTTEQYIRQINGIEYNVTVVTT